MCQNTSDLLNLKDEIKKYKNELSYLLEISKQNEKLIKSAQDSNPLKNEINSLKKEINSLKEINNKTIDFLLLKIESNLDMQKQYALGHDFNNLGNISIPEYGRIINSKDAEIDYLNEKLVELNNKLDVKSDLMDNILSQNEISNDFVDVVALWEAKFNFLKKESAEKDETINSLNEEISVLRSIIDEKDNLINSLRVR